MAVRMDFQWLTTHSSSRLTAGVVAILSNAALYRIAKTVIETIISYPFIFWIANGNYLVVIVNPVPRSGSSNARLQWRTQKIFMGGVFIQWHMVVICVCCALFVTSQFDVIFMFSSEVCWHNRHIFYTHSPYFCKNQALYTRLTIMFL